MDRLVSIPRESLAQLLQAADSPLTPEEYLASLSNLPPVPEAGPDPFRKYRSRAVAAAFSKYFLLIAAIISTGLTCTPIGFGIEGIIVSVSLIALTYFEYRVHSGFRDHQPEAPLLGFRNQSAFALFILIYCLYHAFAPVQIPADYREAMEPDMTGTIQLVVMVSYLAIAIVGGLSQFGLACYYRAARIKTQV